MESLKNLRPLIKRYVEGAIYDPLDKEYYVDKLTAVTKDFTCRFFIWAVENGKLEEDKIDLEGLVNEFEKQ